MRENYLNILMDLHILRSPDCEKVVFGRLCACSDVPLASVQVIGKAFIHIWMGTIEYEHSSSKNRGPSNRPQNTKIYFLKNGSNSFDDFWWLMDFYSLK
jgi:hypothetical protein